MLKKNKVVWSDMADNDLYTIISYISNGSVYNASSIYNKIKRVSLKLTDYPNRGRIVPELKFHGIVLYRELIVHTWRIVYKVFYDHVYVVSVIDARQKVDDILFARFVR